MSSSLKLIPLKLNYSKGMCQLLKLTDEVKVLKVFESFVLGSCKCGCGEQIQLYEPRHKVLRYFINHHHSRGKNNNHWNGGRYKTRFNYILSYQPNHPFCEMKGYIMEHRLIYEQFHKCCMLKWGVIHHKNEVKDDNRIENLEGMTKFNHVRLHHKTIPIDRFCVLCRTGKTIINKRTKRPDWYKFKDDFICRKCYDKKRSGYYK